MLTGSPAPALARPVVSESWRRSLAARVDPELAGPPTVFERPELTEFRSAHPLAQALPVLRETLVSVADEANHMMIITDARGHILWREGQHGVLHRAEKIGLVEGTRWSEDVIGTNAMGTALAEGVAVAIHSAEHLVRTYHAWTCAASPVHDPDTGRIIGVVDVTGPMRGFHPSTMALVNAAAKLAEGQLRERMRIGDERLRERWLPRLAGPTPAALITPTGRVLATNPPGWLPRPISRLSPPHVADPPGAGAQRSPGDEVRIALPDGRDAILEPLPGAYLLRIPTQSKAAALHFSTQSKGVAAVRRPQVLELRFLGAQRPVAVLNGRDLALTRRHADMLTLLALRPSGVTAETLATEVYGERGNPVTARAEVHRLRARLGADVLRSNPYRLHAELDADFLRVREELRGGRPRAAAAAYPGPLRPDSEAPAVREERELLAATLRRAVLDADDPEAMWLLAQPGTGGAGGDGDATGDDAELIGRLAELLARTDPRHAPVAARAARLRRP
ncbi:GAF domain-containing protein [Pseudonocardia eucalypti]|uniref:GAF domain-containing protein n=2 Tax=Pseudonocardia eucalypti TaxID=648755 RepID=A0ABP9R022_9PSEU